MATLHRVNSLWSLGGWFSRSSSPAPGSAPTQPAPTSAPAFEEKEVTSDPFILQLPPDILLSISDHLETPAALSFALACRSTYAVCFARCQKKMSPEERMQFLTLLEKDPLSGQRYYCYNCNNLHPFEKSWGPQNPGDGCKECTNCDSVHCNNRDRFSPTGNPFDLSYTHARLVMNEHLYGSGHGIPLQNICVEQTEQRESTSIHCTTDAKILTNELYLKRTYSFTLTNAEVHRFRKCTGPRDFKICEHTSLFSTTQYRQHIPELLRQSWGGAEAMVPCQEVPRSCGLCLMDYDVTVASVANDSSSWKIIINAFHLVGRCRTPDDWKWARFTEVNRSHLFFPNRPNRRGSNYDAGIVKLLWKQEITHTEVPTPVEQKGLFMPILASTWIWGKALATGSR